MIHIAIDMDDVLVDFVGGLVTAVATEYDVHITREQLEECGWDLYPLLDPIIGRSWWSWLRDREWLWASFPAVPGAIGGIETLRQQGHYLELVTSKPEWAEHNVWKWLGKWRPAFNQVTIVGPDENKAIHTFADILIDDKPENCLNFIETKRDAILFAAPHNAHYTHDRRDPLQFMQRAPNWPSIIPLIGEHNGR